MKSHYRPNVLPAKHITIGQIRKEREDSNYTKSGCGRPKKQLVDICDHCLKPVLMKTWVIQLRKKLGLKFYHQHCYKEVFGDTDYSKAKERKASIGCNY